MVKNPPSNAGDMGSIPESRRFPGEGNENPLQYSCLENSTQDAVTLYRINLANWNLILEVSFLCCTGLEADRRNLFEVWTVQVK